MATATLSKPIDFQAVRAILEHLRESGTDQQPKIYIGLAQKHIDNAAFRPETAQSELSAAATNVRKAAKVARIYDSDKTRTAELFGVAAELFMAAGDEAEARHMAKLANDYKTGRFV